jgi:hypothetical protein
VLQLCPVFPGPEGSMGTPLCSRLLGLARVSLLPHFPFYPH